MWMFLVYRFKMLIRQKENLFWVFAFPILLVSLFNLAFSNLDTDNLFKSPSVAVVGNKEAQVVRMMAEVKNDDENLFKLEYLKEKEALEKLEEGSIDGVLTVKGEEYELTLTSNTSTSLTIAEFLNNYRQTTTMFENIYSKNPKEQFNNIGIFGDYIEEKPISEKTNNLTLISYFAAIAMACFYSALSAVDGLRGIRPNMSMQGARHSISPYSKWKSLAINFTASVINGMSSLFILLLYMKFVLKIDFSTTFLPILIICFVGTITAVALGYVITIITKKSEELAIGLIIGITMTGSALSGMMSFQAKYFIETAVPVAKYLNPVALVTDSFYALYAYDDYTLIYGNIVALLVMFAIFMTIAVNVLRRQKYDSI